jgi:hypothetical protein
VRGSPPPEAARVVGSSVQVGCRPDLRASRLRQEYNQGVPRGAGHARTRAPEKDSPWIPLQWKRFAHLRPPRCARNAGSRASPDEPTSSAERVENTPAARGRSRDALRATDSAGAAVYARPTACTPTACLTPDISAGPVAAGLGASAALRPTRRHRTAAQRASQDGVE